MEDANDSIKIMPEGFNQFDLNFKIIIVGDSGKALFMIFLNINCSFLKLFKTM